MGSSGLRGDDLLKVGEHAGPTRFAYFTAYGTHNNLMKYNYHPIF